MESLCVYSYYENMPVVGSHKREGWGKLMVLLSPHPRVLGYKNKEE